jgi:hypothetical protein
MKMSMKPLTAPPGRLDLLLADAATGRPVLVDGLPRVSLLRAPPPRRTRRGDDAPFLDRPDASPNDLRAQRWGVVAPTGAEGDRILEALTPLLRLREVEQGAPARIYRVEHDMSPGRAVDWKHDVYRARDVPESERPRYLLIAGDLDQISLELQQSLANSALVGRIHFADARGALDPCGYAAYAAKVVARSSSPAMEPLPDLCLYTARDGTRATEMGYAQLVRPCLADAARLRSAGHLLAANVREIAATCTDDLIRAVAGARPSVLLSVSHGLGAPSEGWPSVERQRASQGALALRRGEELGADRVRSGPFLPGGMWFCLACFSAGTPSASAYHPWLAQIGASSGHIESVLQSLPRRGERPFLAAMPQAALANPEGPLAVIGHVDLAWSSVFSDPRDASKGQHARILSTLKALVNGSRAGVALDALMRFYRETNDDLTASYQAEQDAEVRGRLDPTDAEERGHLWMLRNDLRGYVLLGDPAARLPLGRD